MSQKSSDHYSYENTDKGECDILKGELVRYEATEKSAGKDESEIALVEVNDGSYLFGNDVNQEHVAGVPHC